ncbi:MAG: hypothetical protein AAF108_08500 [Planctomycetota bacterium]
MLGVLTVGGTAGAAVGAGVALRADTDGIGARVFEFDVLRPSMFPVVGSLGAGPTRQEIGTNDRAGFAEPVMYDEDDEEDGYSYGNDYEDDEEEIFDEFEEGDEDNEPPADNEDEDEDL